MSLWVILIVVALIGTIIYLTGVSPFKKKGRDEYLEELRDFVEGALESLPGYENSHLLKFQQHQREFEFEDIEAEGFKETTHKAFLKARTDSDLELTFTEQHKTGIKSKIIKATEIDGSAVTNRVRMPSQLGDFNVHTNHIKAVNHLFEDYEIADIFTKYKNIDSRGYPVMALRVHQGTVILEFFPLITMKPNLFNLKHSVAIIDEYLADVAKVAGAINHIKKEKEE